MTPDGFVALVGILIAVWAIMPEYRRFHLKLLCSWWDSLILGLAFIVIVFLYFWRNYTFFPFSGYQANLCVFAVVLVVPTAGYFRLKYSRLKPERNKDAYDRFVNELMQAGKYHALSKFLKSTAKQMIHRVEHKSLVESHSYNDFAGKFICRIYENQDYLKYMAVAYPELGIELSVPDGFSARTFQAKFLRVLLETDGSDLYREIATLNNKGIGYDIGNHTPALNSIFGNMSFAKKREVYRPAGDAMMAELERLSHSPETDQYNWEITQDFQEEDIHRSMLFIGERYFDIMVTEALKQNTQWHMWLYYYPHLMEHICKNYRLGPRNDPHTEFPNRYSMLIEQMFSSLCDWVRAIEHIPEGQTNTKLNAVDLAHENDNIPKSSLIAMEQCLEIVLATEEIPYQFKQYMLSLIFNLYFELRQNISHSRKDAHDYAKIILQMIPKLKSKPGCSEHIQGAWRDYDKIPHRHTPEQISYCKDLDSAISP